MRVTPTRAAAAVTALASGALAAYALQPEGGGTSPTAVSKQPAAEVRTQVIRRTIHVTRHERPQGPTGAGGSGTGAAVGSGTGAAAGSAIASGTTGSSAPRTSASGSQAAGAATPSYRGAVRTASSGSAGGSTSAPVSTRSSGSAGESEGADDHEGGGDD